MNKGCILHCALAAVVAFTSSPEGAVVEVDGVSAGATPLKLYSLEPGVRRHVRVSAQGCESADFFVTPDEETPLNRHVELKPEKGLLLVRSDPAGASVMLEGRSLGETPRLVTSLDAGRLYRFVLKKQGWLDQKAEIRLDGRRPAALDVKMIRDSGVLKIDSRPQGAEVSVNGRPYGATPVVTSDGVPKGRVTVVLKKEGYAVKTAELNVKAGDGQEFFFALEPIPGSLELFSKPEGARFYIDGKPRGKGPLKLEGMADGEYAVRAEMDGYAPQEKRVSIDKGQAVVEEFRLKNILGCLEVKTIPSGAAVFVDGVKRGTTKGVEDRRSDLFRVEAIPEGEHTLVVRCDGYAEYVKHFTMKPLETVALNVALRKRFMPDTRVTTAAGTIEGKLVYMDDKTCRLKLASGVERPIPVVNIMKIETIGKESRTK